MIKSIFYSESVETYKEFALRLEDKNIDYWATPNCAKLHQLVSQIEPDIVFVDYQMFDHNLFNVREYVSKKNKKLMLLYFNNPSQKKEQQLIHWQDDITLHYPGRNTVEVDDFLCAVVGYEDCEPYEPPPTKLRELYYDIEEKCDVPEVNKVPCGCTSLDMAVPVTMSVCDEVLVKFVRLRSKYKIGFSELLLLELLDKNKNRIVTVQQMAEELWQEQPSGHINTIYAYIHNLRSFLKETDKETELVRVKKGCYSLISIG